MGGRPTGAIDGQNRFDGKNPVYRLKVELRREERAGRDDAPYARALRRVLRVCCNHKTDDALVLLQDELLDLERRIDVGSEEVQAFRRALAIVEAKPTGSRELFCYYLRRMEAEGRGEEPFARALRRALQSPGRASLEDVYLWKDEADSMDHGE